MIKEFKPLTYGKFKRNPKIYIDAINDYLNRGYNTKESARKFNIPYRTLLSHIKKRGYQGDLVKERLLISKSKQKNADYFDVIDSHEKAYWLGFVYADGHLNKNNYLFSIELSDKDLCHLKKFADIFGVKIIKRTRYNKNKFRGYSVFSLSNVYLCKKLLEIGFTHNKTYVCNKKVFDNIPDKFFSSFFRGFFDGDGSMFTKVVNPKNIRFILDYCGNKECLNIINNRIYKLVNIKSIIKKNIKTNMLYQTRFYKRDGIKICKWMYQSGKPYLERKHKIYEEYLKII